MEDWGFSITHPLHTDSFFLTGLWAFVHSPKHYLQGPLWSLPCLPFSSFTICHSSQVHRGFLPHLPRQFFKCTLLSSGRLKVIPCSTHCFDPNTFFSGKFLFVLQLLVFLPDTVFVLLCLISFLYILTLAVLPICSLIILNCSHLFIAWGFSQTLSNLTAGYCKSFLSPKLKIPPSHIVDVQ